MAALDFGMALARGMLPTSEKAQKDLINLAGGRNIFKSEDWWNKQVDKQIQEGFRKEKFRTEYKVDTGLARAPGIGAATSASGQFVYKPAEKTYGMGTDGAPQGAVFSGGFFGSPKQYQTREVSLGLTEDRKYFTASELSDIESKAKAGAQRAKKQTAQATAAQKRLRRGTGGLASKAIRPGDKPVTGLPELGTGGLQVGSSTLGKGLVV